MVDSSVETNGTTIEGLQLAPKQKKEKNKKEQQALKHVNINEDKAKGSDSSLKTTSDATPDGLNSSLKRKSAKKNNNDNKKKKQEQGNAADVEHKDKGPPASVDDSSLKNGATTTEGVNSSRKRKRDRKKKKKKKKQGKDVEHEDKGPHVSLDKSSLETGNTTEEVNSSRKKKKKKKQGKDVEHEDKGPHVSLDESSLKTGNTKEEVNSSRKKKKKKQGEAVEHEDKGPHVSLDESSLKTGNTTEEVNSSQKKKKKKKKKKKQGEAVEHEDNGSYVSLDKSSLKTDATTEVNSSPKRKRERWKKKKKQGKAVEHEDNGPHVSLDKSSLETDATTEDPSHESPALPSLLSSQNIVESGSAKKNKRRERQKTKQNATEHYVNSCGAPLDTSSSKTCIPALHMPSEHPIQSELNLVSIKGDDSNTPHFPFSRTVTGTSKKKLLILDVNGLLADFVRGVPRGTRPPDFWVKKKKVYKRPFCDDFIGFCLDKFHVGVWSSRRKCNLDRAIKFLFRKSASKLLFCWSQGQCTKTKFNTLEDKQKPLVFKELRKLWEKTEPDLPWDKGEFNESNTLLLDDSPYKALLNPRYTAIFPQSYHFDDIGDTSLGLGGDLRVYLEGLARAENVQDYF